MKNPVPNSPRPDSHGSKWGKPAWVPAALLAAIVLVSIAAAFPNVLYHAGNVFGVAKECSASFSAPGHANIAASPSPFGSAFASVTSAKLDTAFATSFKAAEAGTMTAAVAVPGKGLWKAQRGTEQPLFFWASVGKQAVAAVVFQLIEEGKLRLSDPISKWIDGVPNGELITVEHLLGHTSGLVSANEYRPPNHARGRLSDAEEMAILREQGPLFAPGECWRYSNSGYNLLARVIAVIDGKPYDKAIETRILQPLDLKQTRVVTPEARTDDIALPFASDGEVALDIAEPGPAGPLAASAEDMIRFEQALFDDRLLRAESRAAMFRRLRRMFDPGLSYGLGSKVYDLPDGSQRVYWIGHSGGGPGIKAVVAYEPRRKAFVAVVINGDGDAHAIAKLLLGSLDPGA